MKQELTSLAKISRPVPRDVILRKWLFSRLDRLRQSPLIWVSGPPGSGKTTLISSYIESSSLPCLWYQVDRGDGDVATLFHFLGLAVKKAAPRVRRPLPTFTPEFQSDLPLFTQRFFRETYRRLKTPSVVVFDNYQDALDEPSFHEVIRGGLAEVPQGMTVIVISHNNPPPTFARMMANHLVELIPYDDLRLTPEESREIAMMRSSESLTEEFIGHLQEVSEGWVAGLLLMLAGGKREGIAGGSMGGAIPEVIFDYFATEIFDQFEEETRQFLMKAAVLPTMTREMAQELTSHSGAAAILSNLARKGRFTSTFNLKQKVWYQFHSLFRHFLLTRGELELEPQALTVVRSQAAEILLEQGQSEAAAELFKKAEEWPKLTTLIVNEAPQLLKEGRSQVVEGWLGSIPKKVVEEDPWLTYFLGLCRLPFNPNESLTSFERAYALFKTENNITGMFLSLVGQLDAVMVEHKDFRRADSLIEELTGLKKQYPHLISREEMADHVTSSIFYALVVRRPDHPDCDYWKERAIGILNKKGDPCLKMFLGGNLIVHYFWTGDVTGAAMVLDRLKRIDASHDTPPLVAAREQSAIMLYYLATAQSESCYRTISGALDKARRSGSPIWESQNLCTAASMAISSGKYEAAEGYLEKAAGSLEAMVYANNFQFSCYDNCMGWLALSRGNPSHALTHFERATVPAKELGQIMLEWWSILGMAQALQEQGRYRKADMHLNKARRIGRQLRSAIMEFMCLIADAQFAFDRGEEKKAVASLRRAFALGKEKDYVNFVLWRHEVMTQLCVKAMEHGIETEYARSLIKRRNLVPETPLLEVEEWPWPVKIFTLGRFELYGDKKTISGKKPPKKPLEMLKVLIALGGSGVSETRISDALWPEADGDAAHRSFITTLMRLRKLVGVDEALHFSDGLLTLDPRYCWVDLWAFKRLLNRVDGVNKIGGVEETISRIDRASALYQGPFLASDDGQPWAVSIRENLKNRFLRSLGDTGRELERAGRYKKAVYYYSKGIETDEFAEGLYLRLMVCYKKLGKRAKAVAVYNHLEKTLSNTFGIKPSPEIQDIHNTLRST